MVGGCRGHLGRPPLHHLAIPPIGGIVDENDSVHIAVKDVTEVGVARVPTDIYEVD